MRNGGLFTNHILFFLCLPYTKKIHNMIPAGPAFHKPKSFIAAKNLLYASIFVAVISISIRDFAFGIAENGGMMALFLTAAGYIIIFLLIKQMSLCKKWARTTLLILYVFMMLSFTYALKPGSGVGLLEGTLLAFQAVLQIIALIFLYREECNNWFNSSTS
jgi:hypothetical protein